MTEVIRSVRDWQELRARMSGSIGFVPTMGALHEGHLSLISRSKSENEKTVVSIFVNPTQFNDASDLAHYPKPFEKDLSLLRKAGADFLFYPEHADLYPDGYEVRLTEVLESERLCGAHRPGHFTGMLTVVMKLLQIIQADRAYFGEKDFQQLYLVQKMARAFFLKTKIVPCETVREKDGLAMSSRNARLTAPERALAATFARLLKDTERSPDAIVRELEAAGFRVDYVEDWRGRRLGAVHLGEVRLIDNVPL